MASVCCICLVKAGEIKCHNAKCKEMMCMSCEREYPDKCPVCTVSRGPSAVVLDNNDTRDTHKAWRHYGFTIRVSASLIHRHVHSKLVRCADALKSLPEENKLDNAFAVIVISLQEDVTLHSYIIFSGEINRQFVARKTNVAVVTVTLTYQKETIHGIFT